MLCIEIFNCTHDNFSASFETGTSVKALQNMFVKAAQRRPIDVDHEVQGALGILCNLNFEYGKAVDCYRAALKVRPNDACLWNRLGVTFTKLKNSKDKLISYQNALDLDPDLTCCHYNIASTYLELKDYR